MRTLSYEAKGKWVLWMSTLGFVACFAVWVVFSIIGKKIQQELGLTNTEFGILIATPILTGSLLRLVVGPLADRYGGRAVLFTIMMATVLPLYLIGAWATGYWDFILLGLCMGLAGTSFAAGITYVAKWYPKEKQGHAMGIFGTGNVGTMITQLGAPLLITYYGGWRMVPQIYAGALALFAIVFLACTYTEESHKVQTNFWAQFAVLKDAKVWRYFQYYSLTFGGFVGLALWMPSYFMSTYGFTLAQAGALVALVFALPGSLIRAYGGSLADRHGAYKVTRAVTWVAWFVLFFMAYPNFGFVIWRDHAGPLAVEYALPWWLFTLLLGVLGLALGVGNASIFKCAANNYPVNAGVVFGAIGLGGGLGGFFLPIMFGALYDWADFPTVCFWLLFGVASCALVWLYWARHHERCACAAAGAQKAHVCACAR